MGFKCIGCDSIIGWDGKGMFCYTCPCGATVFYNDEDGKLAPPASLFRAINKKKLFPGEVLTPHIDYYVGDSDYTSEIKERFIKELLDLGFIWMKDCEQCQKDGTLQRKLDREKALALREAESIIRHPQESD